MTHRMQASWSNDSFSNDPNQQQGDKGDGAAAERQRQQQASPSSSCSPTKITNNLPPPYASKLFDPLKPRKHHTRPRVQMAKDGIKEGRSSAPAIPVAAVAGGISNPNPNPNPNPNSSPISNAGSLSPSYPHPTNLPSTSNIGRPPNTRNSSTSTSSINPPPRSGPYFTHTSPTPSIVSSSRTASSAGIEADRDSHPDASSASELDHYVTRNSRRRIRRHDLQMSRKFHPPSSRGGATTNGTDDPGDGNLSDGLDETTQSEDEDDWLNQTTSEEGGGGGGASKRFDWDRRRGNGDRRRNSSSMRYLETEDGSGTGSGENRHRNVNQKRSTFDLSSFSAGGYFASLGKRRGSAPDISHGTAQSNVQVQETDSFFTKHDRPSSWLDTGILPSPSEDETSNSKSKASPNPRGLRRFSSRDADRPSKSSIKRSSFNFGISETTRARLRSVLPSGLLSSDSLSSSPNPDGSRDSRRGSAGTLVFNETEGQESKIGRSRSPSKALNTGSSGKEEMSDRSRGKRSATGLDGTGGSSSGETGRKPRRSSRLLNADSNALRKDPRSSFTGEVAEAVEMENKDDDQIESKSRTDHLRIPTGEELRRSPREGNSQLPSSADQPPSRHAPSTSSPLSPTIPSASNRRLPPRPTRKRARLRNSVHSHLQSSTFRISLSSFLESLILLLPTYYAIYRLLTRETEIVGGKDSEIGRLISSAASELGWVAVSSTIYWLVEKRDSKGSIPSGVPHHTSSKSSKERERMEPNAIWATDERNYRNCQDDGVLYGLLFGPLLACTSFFASLPPKGKLSPSLLIPTSTSLFYQQVKNANPTLSSSMTNDLPSNFLLPIQTPILLHSKPLPFPPLPLARASLITIQSLTSTALLAHLLATKWIRKPSEFDKSNWKRMRSFLGFSLFLVMGMEIIREGSSWLGIGFWTGLARWELFTVSLVYQLNLYTISRLARKSFTIGELAIVATLGVTLLMESINLTIAKLWPFTTSFVKTFRHPTPLLYYQLALVVGTFIIGFLLSPLLYLSRNLAQKPLHRLRWPAKRDLHRRLLAGFFYFFAAAFVVGVLGMWVRWLLGNKDPWFWVARFVLEGRYRWSRPLLMAYWLALVSASVVGWQSVVLRNKRIRLRAGNSRNMNLSGVYSKNQHTNRSSNLSTGSPVIGSISAVPINPESEGVSGPGQAGMEIVDARRSPTSSTTTSVSLGLSNLSNFSSNLNPFSNQSNHRENNLALGSLPPPNPISASSIPPTPLSPPVQSTPVGLNFTSSNPTELVGTLSSSPLKKAAHLSLNARRKFFHALAVLMFVPGIVFDPAFTHLAFSLCFSLFIFGEYVRYYALYPFGATLHVFLSEFLDSKDSGPVILSHFYLLTGCAAPLWLEGDSVITQLTGVLVLGVGDALASIVGRRYGKKKWWTGGKTVEGTVAFWSSIMFCAWLLRILRLVEQFSLLKYSALIALLALLEGVSAQNDNLILPAFGLILSDLLEI